MQKALVMGSPVKELKENKEHKETKADLKELKAKAELKGRLKGTVQRLRADMIIHY